MNTTDCVRSNEGIHPSPLAIAWYRQAPYQPSCRYDEVSLLTPGLKPAIFLVSNLKRGRFHAANAMASLVALKCQYIAPNLRKEGNPGDVWPKDQTQPNHGLS
jgi:hypothetical protein